MLFVLCIYIPFIIFVAPYSIFFLRGGSERTNARIFHENTISTMHLFLLLFS